MIFKGKLKELAEYGSSFGSGYGYGNGYGDGNGNGYGYGYGDGDGSGSGYGYNYGPGYDTNKSLKENFKSAGVEVINDSTN